MMGENGVSAKAAVTGGDFYLGFVRIGQSATRDPARVGGKASNLIALASAGFPVPDGIVIPVGEYERFIEANGLGERIRDRLARADFGDRENVISCATDIKAMIEESSVEKAHAIAIDAALSAIGSGLWAVRSSAVAEDLEDASFAGQQDTFLNVRPEEVPRMSGDAGRHTGMTAPSPTGMRPVCHSWPGASPWSSSAWSTQLWQASRSP